MASLPGEQLLGWKEPTGILCPGFSVPGGDVALSYGRVSRPTWSSPKSVPEVETKIKIKGG